MRRRGRGSRRAKRAAAAAAAAAATAAAAAVATAAYRVERLRGVRMSEGERERTHVGGRDGAEVPESPNRMSLQLSNNYYRW